MSSSRFNVSPRMLEPFLNPFLEGKPKIMDGAARSSAVVKRSMFYHLQVASSTDLHYILFSAGSKYPIIVKDTEGIKYFSHDNDEFNYKFAQSHNQPTGATGFSFCGFNKSEVSRWRTVCSGLKIENTSALDSSAGYFEAIRIDEKVAQRHLGFQKNFATDKSGTGHLVIDDSYLTEAAAFDKSGASYITGPLTEIGKILFALKPLRDHHPFQDIPELFTFAYHKEGLTSTNQNIQVDGTSVNGDPTKDRYYRWADQAALESFADATTSVNGVALLNALSNAESFIDTQIDQTFDKILIVIHPGSNTELTLKTATYQEICYRPSSTFQRYETTSYENPYQRHALRSVANQLIKAGHSFGYKLDRYSFAGKIQAGSLYNRKTFVPATIPVTYASKELEYRSKQAAKKRPTERTYKRQVSASPKAQELTADVTRRIAHQANQVGAATQAVESLISPQKFALPPPLVTRSKSSALTTM